MLSIDWGVSMGIRALSILHDARVGAYNILLEMPICEYVLLVNDIYEKNEFQRRRVNSSKTVYSLLKQDLIKECVIPSIILALTDFSVNPDNFELDAFPGTLLLKKNHILILDGLQRTYTIMDLLDELDLSGDVGQLKKVNENKIRVEVYVGINRLGILYRMLTLNTGQTPMSLRQQIEILYLDYINVDIDGVKLVRESDLVKGSDEAVINRDGEYNFKDVIEGFNAYINRDELPIEKADLLENIRGLEKLSKENQEMDLFKCYVVALHAFIIKVDKLCKGMDLNDEYLIKNPSPFGKSAIRVFKRPQAMSGFGAAVGRLIDFNNVSDFCDVINIIDKIEPNDSILFLETINDSLNWIKVNTKKIGNAQRAYFNYFFRELLNKDSDSYSNLIAAAISGLRKYQSLN